MQTILDRFGAIIGLTSTVMSHTIKVSRALKTPLNYKSVKTPIQYEGDPAKDGHLSLVG